jgi:hypothetical protein
VIIGLPPRPVIYTRDDEDYPVVEWGPSESTLSALGTGCHRLAAGVLRVVVTHRHSKGVLTPSRRCIGPRLFQWAAWSHSGEVVPGLRFRSGDPFALGIFPLGRRPWTRTYRVEVSWKDRLLLRRWLRVSITRYEQARRV